MSTKMQFVLRDFLLARGTRSIIGLLAGLGSVLTLLHGATAASGAYAQQQNADLATPPTELFRVGDTPRAIMNPTGLNGALDKFSVGGFYDCEEKRITFQTTRTPPATVSVPHPVADQVVSVSYSVRYWPTCIGTFDANTVVVAGKSLTGNTVIELWQLTSPGLISLAGGEVELFSGSRSSVTRIYDQYEPGKNLVQNMVRTKGTGAAKVLVQFYDSKDVYSLDVTSRVLSLVASPQQALPGLHVPPLASYFWASVSASEHVQSGYVYIFRRDLHQVEESGPQEDTVVLALYDSDRNGSIDAFQALNTSSWKSLGYGKSINWID